MNFVIYLFFSREEKLESTEKLALFAYFFNNFFFISQGG